MEELKQKVNNPNLTDEQLDTIATKIAEKGFYTKSEIDSMIADIVVPTKLSQLADDAEHRTVTDTEKEKWNKPSITVDTELSETSENPVQNKAVSEGMDSLYSIITSHFNSQLDNFEEAVDEQLNTKADRTELENYATKEELDTKADKFTIDNEVKADSNNPVSSKAVDSSLNELNNIFRENLQEMGQGFTEQLGTKANTTDIPTKLSQLADDTTHRLVIDEERTKWNALKNVNVVTEVTDENYESEDPIAVKVVTQTFAEINAIYEIKEVSHFTEFGLVGLDKNTLHVITKAWNDVLGYTELWFVFYGRENNKDDTLADGDGDDSISVNGVKALERPLAYIRKDGTYFCTCGHFKLVGGFIFGTVARCDGNGATNTITVEPVQATKIDDIIINTNNLFKGDSKFVVYAR